MRRNRRCVAIDLTCSACAFVSTARRQKLTPLQLLGWLATDRPAARLSNRRAATIAPQPTARRGAKRPQECAQRSHCPPTAFGARAPGGWWTVLAVRPESLLWFSTRKTLSRTIRSYEKSGQSRHLVPMSGTRRWSCEPVHVDQSAKIGCGDNAGQTARVDDKSAVTGR